MPVPCARCSMPLPKWELLKADVASCPSCGSSNTVHLFPAALADAATVRSEAALEGEATCFDHPGKRAVAAVRGRVRERGVVPVLLRDHRRPDKARELRWLAHAL